MRQMGGGAALLVTLLGCSDPSPKVEPDAGVATEIDAGERPDLDGGVAYCGQPAEALGACSKDVGYTSPLEACTNDHPCTDLSYEYAAEGIEELTEPSFVPHCKTSADYFSVRGAYDDGPPIALDGCDGTTRYHCHYESSQTEKRPLIIWLHPGGSGNADNVYDFTRLREKAEISTFAGGTGFHLISVQGRALHYPTDTHRDGNHHDFFHRGLQAPASNHDVAHVDQIIDRYVARGNVDEDRIYVMGWSNGAMFAQLYAIARHESPTPGGNFVAAAAVYSGGDPFHDVNWGDACRLDPYPESSVPLYVARRNCDGALACNATQAAYFDGWPGHDTETWIGDAKTKIGLDIEGVIIDGRGEEVDSCSPDHEACFYDVYGMPTAYPACLDAPIKQCFVSGGIVSHSRWPDGIADGSGNDYEPQMLEFLSANPLP